MEQEQVYINCHAQLNFPMGVTIHFEGQLLSAEAFDKAIETAKGFAENNGLEYFLFKEDNKLLQRVKNEQDWDYEGPTKGIHIQPDESSDPFILEFDKDYYLQEYCKTQFADISVHILIIDLLRQIVPFFKSFNVEDEGEYWETSDINLLQQHIDNCFKVIEEMKQEDATMDGPYRLENGRILDLMQDD
ncbi:MAG TPA: hypothetical protein VF609_11005 [Flavisolibacter sp.]